MYARAPFAEVLAEAAELIFANFNEMKLNQSQTMHLDANAYSALDAAGCLRVFICRVGWELVGYRSFVIVQHQHTGEKVARCDTFYVKPEYRGQCAVGLQRFSDRELRKEGIVWVFQAHNPEKHDLSRFLTACHYRPIETTFARRLIP